MTTLIKSLARIVNDSPVPLSTARRTFRGASSLAKSDRAGQLEAMRAMSTLHKVIALRASSVAQTDWRLYKTTSRRTRTATTETDERVPVDSHLALDVWNRPSPHVSAVAFRKRWSMHKDLTGEAYILPATGTNMAGAPVELWWARPDRMTPIRDPFEYLTGWEYRTPDGKTMRLEPAEVHPFIDPSPDDDYRGMSPIAALAVDVAGARNAAEWNANYFLNSAENGGVIEVAEGLTDDEMDDLARGLEERHQGVQNAHRIMILEHGKWVPNPATMRDMQFVDGRNFSREVVREAYAMPLGMMGLGEALNRATAEAQWAIYLEQEIKPRLDELKTWLNVKYLPMFGRTAQGLEFDYVDPVPLDNEAANAELTAKTAAAAVLRDAGWDPDQVLQTVGLPAMDHTATTADTGPPAVFAARDTNRTEQTPVAGSRNGTNEPART